MSWLSQAGWLLALWLGFYAVAYPAIRGAAWVIDCWVVEPIERWRSRRVAARRRAEKAARELALIERDAVQSVQRIETAFVHAQRLIRDEAGRSRP